eukprot:13647401-Alexandrium_andersonii.AAC.1
MAAKRNSRQPPTTAQERVVPSQHREPHRANTRSVGGAKRPRHRVMQSARNTRAGPSPRRG